jgi:CubicO group peptidase (beta-lactamase class C family)
MLNFNFKLRLILILVLLTSGTILLRFSAAYNHERSLKDRLVMNPPPPVYPGYTWETRSPESLGLNPSKLQQFKQAVGSTSFGCIVRNGYLADRWGIKALKVLGPARMRGWASATKPYVGSLLLFALQEGLVEDLNSPVEQWGWDLREKDRDMTLTHLINMTSGYGLTESPGEVYAYNSYSARLLYLTVIERIYDVPLDDLDAVEALFQDPDRLGYLDFESDRLFTLRHGSPRLIKSTCDMSRFGLMLAREGRWKERQILSPELLSIYLQPQVQKSIEYTRADSIEDYLDIGTTGGGWDDTSLGPGVYGFFWWFNTGGRLWPDVPHDAFQANGHWNRQALTVIPSLDLVVAWRESEQLASDSETFHIKMNDALKLLIDAVEK